MRKLLILGLAVLVLAAPANAFAITAITNPSDLGPVVAGDHPTVVVTFTAAPGTEFRQSVNLSLEPFQHAWELASTTCPSPSNPSPTPFTSCQATLRVATEQVGTFLVEWNDGPVWPLSFNATEYDPEGLSQPTRVASYGGAYGWITFGISHGPKTSPSSFVRVHQATTFAMTWQVPVVAATGFVQIESMPSHRVVRELVPTPGPSLRRWTVRWAGRGNPVGVGQPGKVLPAGRYRFRAEAWAVGACCGNSMKVISGWSNVVVAR